MSRLSLFGAIHFDRRSKVEGELSEFVAAEDADAIFVEWPESALAWRVVLSALLRVPMVLIGGVVLDLVRSPYYFLFNRRLDSTEHMVTERLGRPVHEIDQHPWALMAEAGPLAIIPSWLLLFGFLVLAPVQTAVTTAALVVSGAVLRAVAIRGRNRAAVVGTVMFVGLTAAAAIADPFVGALALALAAFLITTGAVMAVSSNLTIVGAVRLPVAAVMVALALAADLLVGWVVLASFVAFGVFVTRTLDTRNEHMAERIATIARKEGYDSSVLVTGAAHLPGMVEQANDAGLSVERKYTPRWLRPSDKIEVVSVAESAESADITSDTVPIELGSAGARAAASVVDFVALAVLVWVPALVLGVVTHALLDSFLAGALAGVVLTPLAYYVLLEARYGRTLGKHLEGLVVTDGDGLPASGRACLLRNLLRPVDFLAFYLLGFVLVLATDRDQRLGDLVAGTEIRVKD
jgi:uncharacterized RDD family membrane protein YckC